MSGIRFRYSGIVAFSANILSVLTGLIFSVVVTRRLSVQEFGTWQFYSSSLAYFALPSYIVNYWLTRNIGRGKSAVNSALTFNAVFSWLATILFFATSIVLTNYAYASNEVIIVFGIWLLTSYLSSTTDAAASGSLPHLYGYGVAVFELAKVISGAILVAWLRLGLAGAVISVDIALLLRFVLLYFLVPESLKGRIGFSEAFGWLRRFWIPLTSVLPGLIFSLDVILVTIITGNPTSAAYVRASTTFSMVILFSNSLSIALYPKLLSGGGRKEIEDSLKMVMMFAIPMFLGIFFLAEPLLYLLRAQYATAVWVLRAYATLHFLGTIKAILITILLGTEKVDIDETATYKEFSSSSLMKVPMADILNSSIYIGVILVSSFWLNSIGTEPVMLSLSLAVIYIVAMLPFLLYYWRASKRRVEYSFPVGSLARYLAAGSVMVCFLLFFFPTGAMSEQIFNVMVSLLPVIGVSAILYFSVLIAIDGETRQLVVLVLARIEKIIKDLQSPITQSDKGQ